MNTSALKFALLKALKVFLKAGLSAIVALLVAWLQDDPRFLILAPAVNTAWVLIEQYLVQMKVLGKASSKKK